MATTPATPPREGVSWKIGMAATTSAAGIKPRTKGYATAKSPWRYAAVRIKAEKVLRLTVPAMKGHDDDGGGPTQKSTPKYGSPAPKLKATMALPGSGRDFTQAFQLACMLALTSMAMKTVHSTQAPAHPPRRATTQAVPVPRSCFRTFFEKVLVQSPWLAS